MTEPTARFANRDEIPEIPVLGRVEVLVHALDLALNLVSSPRLATTSHRPRNGLLPAQTQPEVRSGVTAQIGHRRTR